MSPTMPDTQLALRKPVLNDDREGIKEGGRTHGKSTASEGRKLKVKS